MYPSPRFAADVSRHLSPPLCVCRVGKVGYSCEYGKRSLSLYSYLLLTVLFIWVTVVNWLLPHPVYVCVHKYVNICTYICMYLNCLKVSCRHVYPIMLQCVFSQSKYVWLHNHSGTITFRKVSLSPILLSSLQFVFRFHQFPVVWVVAVSLPAGWSPG